MVRILKFVFFSITPSLFFLSLLIGALALPTTIRQVVFSIVDESFGAWMIIICFGLCMILLITKHRRFSLGLFFLGISAFFLKSLVSLGLS